MKELTCVICPRGCRVTVSPDFMETTGNKCPRGRVYAIQEAREPKRILTTTVQLEGSPRTRLPVRTDLHIKKELMADAMELLKGFWAVPPIKAGDILIHHILGTEVNIIASANDGLT